MTAAQTDEARRGVILITGAAGRIGRLLRRALSLDPALAHHYGGRVRLRVTDIVDPGVDAGPGSGATVAFQRQDDNARICSLYPRV